MDNLNEELHFQDVKGWFNNNIRPLFEDKTLGRMRHGSYAKLHEECQELLGVSSPFSEQAVEETMDVLGSCFLFLDLMDLNIQVLIDELVDNKLNSRTWRLYADRWKGQKSFEELLHRKGSPAVVTLCGSTRFMGSFLRVQKELTLQGFIVISVGLFGQVDSEVELGTNETPTKVKLSLDNLHKQKIDISDAIYVINEGGYIEPSTKSEIDYAVLHGKTVLYMEDKNDFTYTR